MNNQVKTLEEHKIYGEQMARLAFYFANKGYSATPYCNQVSPAGGQELVNETLKVLKDLKK